MTVEILYLAWNRLAMTRWSFRTLIRNTDWPSVDRLVVYDDDSTDGTAEYLQDAGAKIPVPAFEFRTTRFRSPPITMNDYLAHTDADVFAKIDNDIAVPPRWLDAMLGVMQRSPELELLGMEAARNGEPNLTRRPRYRWVEGSHIGGVGLMRTSAFHRRPAIPSRGRFGFTEWQHRHNPVRGWIVPDLRVVQLDLIPQEPWRTLAAKYVAAGWAREWTPYDPLRTWWWDWLEKPPQGYAKAAA